MFHKTKKAADRAAAVGKARDVIDRAAAVSNPAVGQSADKLGTAGLGKDIL